MTYPLVQFVSAPDVDADVRFDFNAVGSWADAETWPGHEGFSIGVPSLEGDPDAVGVEYGFRELSFSLFIKGDKSSALAAQSALAKEILRRTNWLRFQLTEHSEPVWFKTYRTAPGELDFQYVYTETAVDHWGIAVTLTADPFAYGARETLPTVTINNDPAAATNPMSVVLPAIKGDAPAPLRVDLSSATTHQYPSLAMSIAPATPVVLQVGTGDAFTANTDTGPGVTAGGYSGGSYRPITFATNANMTLRLQTIASIPQPGRYLAFLRVTRSDTSSTFAFQLSSVRSQAAPVAEFDRPASPSAGYTQWVNLGELSLPALLADAEAAAGPFDQSLSLDAMRRSGTGEARVDALVLVPVVLSDTKAVTLYSLLSSLDPYTARWDGDGEFFQTYVNGKAAGSLAPIQRGEYLKVAPGQSGVFVLFRQTDSAANTGPSDLRTVTDNSDVLSASTSATISYLPRYLYLAGA